MTEPPVPPLARLPEEWAAVMQELGVRSYRAKQVFEWIFQHGVVDPAAMTNLSLGLRERLRELSFTIVASDAHASPAVGQSEGMGRQRGVIQVAKGCRL